MKSKAHKSIRCRKGEKVRGVHGQLWADGAAGLAERGGEERDRQRTRLGQTSRVQRRDGRTGAEGRSANINCFRKSLYNVLTVTVGRNLGLLITAVCAKCM